MLSKLEQIQQFLPSAAPSLIDRVKSVKHSCTAWFQFCPDRLADRCTRSRPQPRTPARPKDGRQIIQCVGLTWGRYWPSGQNTSWFILPLTHTRKCWASGGRREHGEYLAVVGVLQDEDTLGGGTVGWRSLGGTLALALAVTGALQEAVYCLALNTVQKTNIRLENRYTELTYQRISHTRVH